MEKIAPRNDFIIGVDDFSNLMIRKSGNEFHYFFDKKNNKLVKEFTLTESERVRTVCEVTLIERGGKFTPRLSFSKRNISGGIPQELLPGKTTLPESVKARVGLDACHENLWKLINYLQTFKGIEVPEQQFSLVSQDESEIIVGLQGRDKASIISIIHGLVSRPGFQLSSSDISILLRRKEKLADFEEKLRTQGTDEADWQIFFEENKWIFGYGLNYQILKQQQPQAHYGGQAVDGAGYQKGDYLTSTTGDISFTVLVEIKTPNTPLLKGSAPVRKGAWGLSSDLTDAVSQIQANIHMWESQGSVNPVNQDRFEKDNVFTIEPKGIVVIGRLNQFQDYREKRATFERFRKSIHGIDILTFDELFSRARFIVENEVA